MKIHASNHVNDLIASRRALLGGLAGLPLLNLAACATPSSAGAAPATQSFANVPPTNADTVTLPPGYRWQKLIAWGDALFDGMAPFDPDALTRAEQERRFGQNNDMLALFPERYAFPWPTDQANLILCANNEYVDPALTFPSLASARDLSAEQLEALYAAVGVSVVQVTQRRGAWSARTEPQSASALNRRITPFSPVRFSGPAAQHRWIAAASAKFNEAEPGPADTVRCGTLANCAGGVTPWGTYLSSEENFGDFFVLTNVSTEPLVAARTDSAWLYDAGRFGFPLYSRSGAPIAPRQFDMSQNPYGPSLYGWVVEIDPYDPSWTPRKRTALGRKKGECATTAIAKDGRVAVYMGDDQIDHFVFKFVSDGVFNPNDRLANRDLLDHGKLYAARLNEDGTGEWIELTVEACNAAVQEAPYHAEFADYGDVVTRAREAATLLGATQMDRPEDVEAPIDREWRGLGSVLVVCTNNRNDSFQHPGNPRRGSAQVEHEQQANHAGHILRFDEVDGDHAGTRFTWNVFALAGDPEPDPAFTLPGAIAADVSTTIGGQPTFTGARFTCPDNICFDSAHNVWIATDGSPAVFPDCNDAVLVTSTTGAGPRDVKRFLVGPVGAEICGPTLSPDETAFLCAIQHPGDGDVAGASISDLRWRMGQRPPSTFPDGGESWPRSAVVVVTREDGGKVGG
ncbi:MAG: PhoX family phosphatase [Hyphomonadaceae bacterium]|nr:PhoX family phosphatase [Hyphomonadaceae bacterium]